MPAQLFYLPWITRQDLRSNPEFRYVFGDNVARKGMGGQAGAMRGEPNAIGVATKWTPTRDSRAYFSDGDERALRHMLADIDQVRVALSQGRTVYVPTDGLGTGLSELPTRAPSLYRKLVEEFRTMSGPEFPWDK